MQAPNEWFSNSKRDFKLKARGDYITRLIHFKHMNRRHYGQVHIRCITWQSVVTYNVSNTFKILCLVFI